MVYPQFSSYTSIKDINDMYDKLVRWSNTFIQELETRDIQKDNKPSNKFQSVVTVTNLGNPQSGDIAFSIGESKFKGYTGSAWVDLH